MESYKKEFIEFMVESDVLKFGEFTLKSGRKSPFFMNAGAYVTGSQLKRLGEYYAKAIYDKYYKDEYFVRVLDKDVCPQTKWVEGSNFVDVNFKIDKRTNRIIMMGAIDNLVKGAAGQAVQNMNLMFGLKETEGMELVQMFP